MALEGQYQESYWTHPLEGSEGDNLPACIDHASNRLGVHRDFFTQIRATGGRVGLFVGLFARGENIGVTLPADLLDRLADLGIDLELDIYGDQKDFTEPV